MRARCAHLSTAVNLQFSIYNFQFAIRFLQRQVLLAKSSYCKLKIENLKLTIDGLRAEPALGKPFEVDMLHALKSFTDFMPLADAFAACQAGKPDVRVCPHS